MSREEIAQNRPAAEKQAELERLGRQLENLAPEERMYVAGAIAMAGTKAAPPPACVDHREQPGRTRRERR